jgi:hypothetical protein
MDSGVSGRMPVSPPLLVCSHPFGGNLPSLPEVWRSTGGREVLAWRAHTRARQFFQNACSMTEGMMLNHLIYVFALLVIAAGVLVFWVFSSLGLVLLIAFFGNGGNFFDLYRIRRFERNSLNRMAPGRSIRPSTQPQDQLPGPPAGDLVSPIDPNSFCDDDLALALATLAD